MDLCDKLSYQVPFAKKFDPETAIRVPRYNKPDGEPIDPILREQADTVRWNTSAPKAPDLRVGATRGALRTLQRKRVDEDGN